MGDARYKDATVEAVIAVVRESLSRPSQNESGKVYDCVVSIFYSNFEYYSRRLVLLICLGLRDNRKPITKLKTKTKEVGTIRRQIWYTKNSKESVKVISKVRGCWLVSKD